MQELTEQYRQELEARKLNPSFTSLSSEFASGASRHRLFGNYKLEGIAEQNADGVALTFNHFLVPTQIGFRDDTLSLLLHYDAASEELRLLAILNNKGNFDLV